MTALTPEAVGALLERLESHMGKQDPTVLLADCREAAAVIRGLLARNKAELLSRDPAP